MVIKQLLCVDNDSLFRAEQKVQENTDAFEMTILLQCDYSRLVKACGMRTNMPLYVIHFPQVPNAPYPLSASSFPMALIRAHLSPY